METPRLSAFGRVDESGDPAFYVRYLDTVSQMGFLDTAKANALELLRLAPGMRILDVGCGTGEDVRSIAQAVGTSGFVVGVDLSESMVAEANRRSDRFDLPVHFSEGDAQHLDFPDDSFDGCRAERLLQH